MVSDNKEVLITFHEDPNGSDDTKKKNKIAGIWTNYSAFVKILTQLFSKMQ
jgi:hypothetical protein